MSELRISVSGTKRLLTKGKFCDKNIVVTAEGGVDRYDEGVADGKQAQYNAFWDAYQDNGKSTTYAYAFRGPAWNDATFKPKYDIVCGQWDGAVFHLSGITDLKGILEAQGVTLDTSNVSGGTNFFNQSHITRIPALDLRSMTTCLSMFQNCTNLQEIELNNVREDLTGNDAFRGCYKLTTIRVTGTIGTSVFNIPNSPLLTNESVQSIIDCLKDLTGLATQTLTFHADVGAKMTDAQKATITAKNWTLVY